MKVLFVTGARDWNDPRPIQREFDAVQPDLVIEGAARGADALAGREARLRDMEPEEYPAEWDRYGRAAGPIRNGWMLARLEELRAEGHEVVCRAFHEDLSASKGTADMVEKLRGAGFEVEVRG